MGNRDDMTVIEVDRRVAEALAATAAARGLSLKEFLRSVGGLPAEGHSPGGPSEAPHVDLWLEELSSGSVAGESLPTGFSRADVYHDHD